MKATPKFYGLSEKGNVKFERWSDVSRYLTTMDGKRVEIVIKPYRAKRSNPQNRYYHGVIIPILADYFGYEHEEMHDAIKWEFLKIVSNGLDELDIELLKEENKEIKKTEEINRPQTVTSTAKLTTAKFNKLIERIQRWAAMEHGVFIPDPQEVEYG